MTIAGSTGDAMSVLAMLADPEKYKAQLAALDASQKAAAAASSAAQTAHAMMTAKSKVVADERAKFEADKVSYATAVNTAKQDLLTQLDQIAAAIGNLRKVL
jgi:cytochrome c556